MGLYLTLPAKDRDLNVWDDGGVPFEYAVRGFYSVALSEEGFERTAGILEELGFSLIGQEKSRFRYKIKNSETGASIVDVLCLPYTPSGYIGVGSVHHVALVLQQRKKSNQGGSSKPLNATPESRHIFTQFISENQEVFSLKLQQIRRALL